MLLLASCSSGDDGGSEGVASLTDTNGTADETVDAELTAEDAALAWASCMRDAGIDVPDPEITADGGISFQGVAQAAGVELGGEEFQEALEVCGELLEGVILGPGGGGGNLDALEDALFVLTECLRDEGLDVGDVDLGAIGPGGDGGPGGGGPGGGQAFDPQQQATPGAALANLLGVDAEDPAFQSAFETCQPAFTEALTDAGLDGGPGGGPDGQ